MMNNDTFLDKIDEIAAEEPEYELGHDGSDGRCDCIGLVIGAIRRSGGVWEGTHGSNYAARYEMATLAPIADASELCVGELVFKAAAPGSANHNLPNRYDKHSDQNDYYHVGVVRSVSPLRIIHCTGPGIVTDTKLGKWSHHGWLYRLTEEGEKTMADLPIATLCAESGSTVNVRTRPNGDLVDRLPVGLTVPVSSKSGEWCRIAYGNISGWVMSKFLCFNDEDAAEEPEGTVTLTLRRSDAERLRDALSEVLGWG